MTINDTHTNNNRSHLHIHKQIFQEHIGVNTDEVT